MKELTQHGPEQEPQIVIRKSKEAPPEVKANPFYDPEYWGRALSPDDIYLPESDEAISFAIASHEIGHLVEKGAIPKDECRLDNFEATKREEQRACDVGWPYLKNYLKEYLNNDDWIKEVEKAYEDIMKLLMQAMDISKVMYLEPGSLEDLAEEERQELLEKTRIEFYESEKSEEIKRILEKIKNIKLGKKVDWERYVEIIAKAIKEIEKDNKKFESKKI